MVYLSLGIRFKANVEALNMTETVGNVSRHRRVPVVIKEREGFRLYYVPAISGESLAHAFQANLVEAAKLVYAGRDKIPVDQWSMRGEFIKFADNQHLTDSLKKIIGEKKTPVEEKQHLFEKTAIQESIVADIGGFLYAENPPVRRTSPFQVGYATPVEEALEATAIEPQMHARQVATGLASEEQQREAQMLYYVEIASAVYGVTMCLDFDSIGKTSMVRIEDAVDSEERKQRIKAAIIALALTTGQQIFGAKRSRFNPILEVLDAVAVVSHPLPFTVSPPQKKEYIKDTISRAEKYVELLSKAGIKADLTIITYGTPDIDFNKATMEEFFLEIYDKVMRLV